MQLSEKLIARQGTIQLSRLRTLTDVVFAIVLWRAFYLIPHPDTALLSVEQFADYVGKNWLALVSILVALLLTIIYWVQNNALTADLERTDFRHTALLIFQIIFLLLFLRSLRYGVDLGGVTGTRIYESVTAALVGFSGSWAWSYATRRRRLLRADVPDSEVKERSLRILAEPITALLTIPISFIGPGMWELAWFSYPLVLWFLRSRARMG